MKPATDEIVNPTRSPGWRFSDRHGDAFGICSVSFHRDIDRRYWYCVPHGDRAGGSGIWPIVRAVCDDFGDLRRVS